MWSVNELQFTHQLARGSVVKSRRVYLHDTWQHRKIWNCSCQTSPTISPQHRLAFDVRWKFSQLQISAQPHSSSSSEDLTSKHSRLWSYLERQFNDFNEILEDKISFNFFQFFFQFFKPSSTGSCGLDRLTRHPSTHIIGHTSPPQKEQA